eukprot:184620_1
MEDVVRDIKCCKKTVDIISAFGLCCKEWMYIKVLFWGFFSFCAIFGIYAHLSNINEIAIQKIYASTNGIYCFPNTSQTEYEKQYCDNIAVQMAINEEGNSDWFCHTDYSASMLYDDLTVFYHLIIALISVSFGLNCFAVIHDCILISYALPETKENIQKNSCCNAFKKTVIRISSECVGICRFCIVLFAFTLNFSAYTGFRQSIPSPADECDCGCGYRLKGSDFAPFLVVSYVLAFTNLTFLIYWVKESKHKQPYLYLISYSLPISYAVQLNPNNPGGSMFNENNVKIKVQEESKETEKSKINKRTRNIPNIEPILNNVNCCNIVGLNFRRCLLILMMIWIVIQIGMELIIFGRNNPYNYNSKIANGLWIFGIVYFLVTACCIGGLFAYNVRISI